MNTRIATSLIALGCLSLAAGLAPLQPAVAAKPSRVEARQEGEDLRKAPQIRRGQPDTVKQAAPAARSAPPAATRVRPPAPSAPPAATRVRPPAPSVPPAATRVRPPATSVPPPAARREDRGSGAYTEPRRHDGNDGRQARSPPTYQARRDYDQGSRHRYDGSRHRYDGSRYRYADARSAYRYPSTHHHYPARRYYYPPRGYVAPVLPGGVVVVNYNSSRYWYGGGIWYRPYGARYVVVAPPLGVYVSVLPAYYTTYWYAGVPYYYANDAYYLWRESRSAYEVVAPPPDAQVATADPVTEDIYVYPREGQSEDQMAFDRYECHRWAADETGFDPTQPWGGVSEDQAGALREAYLRAMTACLEGRGYTVR